MSAPTLERTEITQPGVYDLDEATYHGDPVPAWSLSVSGARTIRTKSPAAYLYQRDHGRPPKAAFDFGHAAHKTVLGVGADLVVVPFEDWRKADARDMRDQAYADGKTPVLEREFEVVQDMATALRKHPTAGPLLDPERGEPEKSLFWRDQDIWRRGRLDWLPNQVSAAGRMLIADYKTALSANPVDFDRSAASYGYDQQASWYIDAVKALNLADDASFLFVVQEKEAPYLVSVIELHPDALLIGDIKNQEAIATFRRCLRTSQWPGYDPDVHLVRLPAYIERQYEQEINR